VRKVKEKISQGSGCDWKPEFCRLRGYCLMGLKRCRKQKKASPKREPYKAKKVRVGDLK